MRNAAYRERIGRRGSCPAASVGAGRRPASGLTVSGRASGGVACAKRGVAARGVALLEAIISLGLLVFGMAVVGYQINTALRMANAADLRTRALLLVDSKMAELDAGVIRPSWTGDDVKGYFGIAYPGYSWRVRVKPAEIADLYLVTLEIGYNEANAQAQIENPDQEIDIDDADTHILRTAYRLIPKPADVSLQRDFGLTQEELDELINGASAAGDANAVGGGEGGAGGPGGGTGDPMMDMFGQLIQALVSSGMDPNSINPRDLAQYLDAETLDALGPLIDMYFGNGPAMGSLPGPLDNPMLRNLLNRGGQRGGRGGRGGRDRGGRDGRRGDADRGGQDQGGANDGRGGEDGGFDRGGRNNDRGGRDRGERGGRRGDTDRGGQDRGGADDGRGGENSRFDRGGRSNDRGGRGNDRGGRGNGNRDQSRFGNDRDGGTDTGGYGNSGRGERRNDRSGRNRNRGGRNNGANPSI